MADVSVVFDTYEKEYGTLHESLSNRLTNLIPTASPDKRKLLVNQAERELEEVDEIISHMEIELQSLAQPVRTRLQVKLRMYKDEVKKFKKDMLKFSGHSERDQLLGRGGSHTIDVEVASMDQRTRLLQGTERLQDGSRRLEDARRLALETEAIGISTLEDLNRQREQIIRTRDTLGNADSFIAKSQGILKGMQQRIAASKLLTAGIIVTLVLIILLIIYLKWFR
ncbi:t-SNARE [Cladochytrium replicatum]|nr:t-SNARE [Cladochytrium replicatum]